MFFNPTSNFLSSLSIRLGRAILSSLQTSLKNKVSLLGFLFCVIASFSHFEANAAHVYAKSITYQRINYTRSSSVTYNVVFSVTYRCDAGQESVRDLYIRNIRTTIVTNISMISPGNEGDNIIVNDYQCGCNRFDNLCYKTVRYTGQIMFSGIEADDNYQVFDNEPVQNPERGLVNFKINTQTRASSPLTVLSPVLAQVPNSFNDNNINDVIPFCLELEKQKSRNVKQVDLSITPPPGIVVQYSIQPTILNYRRPNFQLITYDPGYSDTDPLGPYGQTAISPQGQLTITSEYNPNGVRRGNFVITVRAEFRNGNNVVVASYSRNIMIHGRASYDYDNITSTDLLNDPWLRENGVRPGHLFVDAQTNPNVLDLAGTSLSIGKNLMVNNTFTVNDGTILFGESANAIISNRNGNLTLQNNAVFTCCSNNTVMWKGINCSNGNVIVNNSEIACAEVGFLLTAKGKGNFSQNTTFNENGRHVVIQQIDRQNNEPVSIEGCNLLCLNPLIAPYAGKRTLTGISILNNPEKVNITIGRGDGVPNVFKDIPEVEGYFGTNQDVKPVGSGIFVNRSNAKIVRNTFTNTGLSSGFPRMFYGVKVENYYFVPTPPTLPAPPINPERYTVSVERNLFDDIQNGFFYKNFNTFDDIKVTDNEFRKIVNYPLAPPQTNTDLTKNSRAVRIQGATFRSVIAVSGNTISDSRLGIEASGLFKATISRNNINNTTNDANYTTFRGITIIDPVYVDKNNSTEYDINRNVIGEGQNTWVGIYYGGLKKPVKGKIMLNDIYHITHGIVIRGQWDGIAKEDFANNQIINIRRLAGNIDQPLINLYGSYSGIHLWGTRWIGLSFNRINNLRAGGVPNTVPLPNRNYLEPVTGEAKPNKAAHGILLTESPYSNLCANSINLLEHGITARNNCTNTKLIRNAMTDNFFGVSVAAQGILGTQGGILNENRNIVECYQNGWWISDRYNRTQDICPFNDGKFYSLFSFDKSPGPLSKFYTPLTNRNNSCSCYYNPLTPNLPFQSAASPEDISQYKIPVQSNDIFSYYTYEDCDNIRRGGVNGENDNGNNGLIHINDRRITYAEVKDLENLAAGGRIYPLQWESPLRYSDEQLVYAVIRERPRLRTLSAVLDSFWLSHQNTNLALLDSIGINLYGISAIPTSTGACNAACQLLRSFIPQNQIEANYKTVYIRLADWWMNNRDTLSRSQLSELKSIARQCPFTGGGAVNEAMNILTWGGVQVLDSVDRCMDIDYTPAPPTFPKMEWNQVTSDSKIKLYPNPAREQVTLEYQAGEMIRLEVYDVKGVLVYSTDLTGKTHALEVSKWNKGIYLCKFTGYQGSIQTQKLVVE